LAFNLATLSGLWSLTPLSTIFQLYHGRQDVQKVDSNYQERVIYIFVQYFKGIMIRPVVSASAPTWYIRERPFNLKGGYGFFLKKYSDSQCC
jgi:hypothetical protein